VLLLLGWLVLLPVTAAEIHPLKEIRQRVEQFLAAAHADAENPPRIEVGSLDRRLRLAACAEPLEASLPKGYTAMGRTTVAVRCNRPKPWTLYVQATVSRFEAVVTAARTLPRGTRLAADDLRFRERNLSDLISGYFTEKEAITGQIVTRTIRAGAPLSPNLLEAPSVVRRGERVAILAREGGLEVRMSGRALEDGAKGELIRVKNRSSGREVEAVVVEPGVVQVRM